MNEIIVSLCSGAIKAALALIRISGEGSFEMVNSVFTNKKEHQHQHVYYGYMVNDQEKIDEVMVSFFKGPHSFTGEDMVEISCHGSMLIVQNILSLFIAKGARFATNGEFTKRAFLNGRIDLIEAESVNDLINAESKFQAQLALNGLEGKTSQYVENLANQLLDIISQIEVNIDYPEYDDIEQLTIDHILPSLDCFLKQLDQVIEESQRGQIIKDGIKTVIVGKPNVGKSSLLNALLKEEKAIVTDIAGTTRDIVEGKINMKGLTLNLIDTAGLHESDDKIEKIGMLKSLQSMQQAQLILLVLDASMPLTDEDLQLLDKTKDRPRIILLNKSDLPSCFSLDEAIEISAKNKDIESLEKKIVQLFPILNYQNEPLLFNARQEGLLHQAKAHLMEARNQALQKQMVDLINIDIQEAYRCILEILGKVSKEDLLDNIFSKFCLGK